MSIMDSEIPDIFVCPLTMDLMKDPLYSKYGHNFERNAILLWLAKENTCPITRQPLFPSMLIPDNSLQVKLKAWKVARGGEDLYESEDEEVVQPVMSFPSNGKIPQVMASAVLRDEHTIRAIRMKADQELRRSSLKHMERRS